MHKAFSRILLIVLTVLFTEHLVGMTLPAYDPIQSEADAQAEVDGSQEGTELDCTVAQRSDLDAISLMQLRTDDSFSCPREAFASDFFRPPTAHAL